VIVAAGRGTRFGAPGKVLLELGGRPILTYSLDAAEAATSVSEIVIVAGEHTQVEIQRTVDCGPWAKIRSIVLGGERRQDSVLAGLNAVSGDIDIVAIHDAARPFVTAELFDLSVDLAVLEGAAIVAVPVTDTLKRVRDGRIEATVPRDDLWAAQTPQAFTRSVLDRCFELAAERGLDVTDEARLAELLGVAVGIVPGSSRNLKITRPEDLAIGEALIAAARIGAGA
jgi:2-C-methyl-D-erythritol 4-phosphate cytidylyltransferase